MSQFLQQAHCLARAQTRTNQRMHQWVEQQIHVSPPPPPPSLPHSPKSISKNRMKSKGHTAWTLKACGATLPKLLETLGYFNELVPVFLQLAGTQQLPNSVTG